jgi:hypothetical protein
MKHSIRLTGPNGAQTYLSHRGKSAFSPATARKYLSEWLQCNPGGTARIEDQHGDPVKRKPRSYFGIVRALNGYVLNGGKPSVRSVRFRMQRDCQNWIDAMMAQPFAHSGTVYSSAKAPDLNAITR